MTDRDEMIERAKAYIAERNLKTAYSDEAQVFADFALAEIARAEADLRAKLVGEMQMMIIDTPAADGRFRNHAIERCIEIVRGEGGE